MVSTQTHPIRTPESEGSPLDSGAIAQAELYKQALGHESRVAHLVRLPLDEELYPAQNIDTRFIDGRRLDSGVINDYVTGKDSRFPEIPKKLLEAEKTAGLLGAIGNQLESGGNVIITCPHEQVTDLGYLSVAYAEVLDQMGIGFRASIVAGKMIPYLGYQSGGRVDALTDIMQMCGERVYLSYPPETKSTANSAIPAREIRKNNIGMGKQLAADLDEGGWLLAMDPLGTTLKINGGRAVLESEGISKGTLGILQHPKTLVVAHGLVMSGEHIAFDTDSQLRKINDANDLQALLDAEAALLTRIMPGVEFISPPLPDKLFDNPIGRVALGAVAP